ncbi:MAG: hypothetical protein HC841_08055 [Verrucomicrobiae bacterium]|nr:hypothetical protein [Verrucomicrobiae bacterium]
MLPVEMYSYQLSLPPAATVHWIGAARIVETWKRNAAASRQPDTLRTR